MKISLFTASAILGVLQSVVAQNATLPASWPTSVIAPFVPKANLTLIFPTVTVTNENSGVFISIPNSAMEPTYILEPPIPGNLALFVLDPDAPNGLSLILHGFKTDVMSDADGQLTLATGRTAVTPYMGPGPPAGPAHHYTVVVYEQPADFKLPAGFNANNRVQFNLTAFAAQNKLGEPVAGQYFTSQR